MTNIETFYREYEAAKRGLAIANRLSDKRHVSKVMAILNKKRAALKHAQQGTKPPQRWDIAFESTVAGIPCGVYVCPIDGEISIRDRRGYEAKWLGRKATDKDYSRLEREYDEIIATGYWEE